MYGMCLSEFYDKVVAFKSDINRVYDTKISDTKTEDTKAKQI